MIGGVLSIVFAVVFMTYVVTEFKAVVDRKVVNKEEKTYYANDALKIKIDDVYDLFVVSFEI